MSQSQWPSWASICISVASLVVALMVYFRSVRAFELDERAWVTVSQFMLTTEPEIGKDFHIDFWLQNTGKSPALAYSVDTQVIFSTQSQQVSIPTTASSGIAIPPGRNDLASAAIPTGHRESDIVDYRQKRTMMFLYAVLRYQDIFGHNHTTSVCVSHIYQNPLNQFDYCGSTIE